MCVCVCVWPENNAEVFSEAVEAEENMPLRRGGPKKHTLVCQGCVCVSADRPTKAETKRMKSAYIYLQAGTREMDTGNYCTQSLEEFNWAGFGNDSSAEDPKSLPVNPKCVSFLRLALFFPLLAHHRVCVCVCVCVCVD